MSLFNDDKIADLEIKILKLEQRIDQLESKINKCNPQMQKKPLFIVRESAARIKRMITSQD